MSNAALSFTSALSSAGATPGTWLALSVAQDWTGAAAQAGDEHAVKLAWTALLGWLDLDVRDPALEAAVKAECAALVSWLEG